MLGNFDDIQKMSKTNVDVTMKSFGAASTTAQAIATEMAEYSKRSFDNNRKTIEKLFGVKSLDKVIEVQSEYAKSIYEDYAAQANRLGELYADFAREVFKPFVGNLAKTPSAD